MELPSSHAPRSHVTLVRSVLRTHKEPNVFQRRPRNHQEIKQIHTGEVYISLNLDISSNK
ncbi:hypothetical protein SAMD00019534_019190, partial [Acytostelium subglobosum LB1]|uniref:hypothetical protein n=1 Tax=Acytostelium subglobosum LB1 TaxID=1410327 RepID=UPI000644FA70